MGILSLFKRKKDVKKIRKELDNKLKALKDPGLKETIQLENLRDDFFDLLLQINYEKNKSKKKKMVIKARKIAEKIPEFSGWPKSSKFWDVEALNWIASIPESVRNYVKKEINSSIPKGLSLSLGCGSYPYVKDSVLVDFSEEMLKSAPPQFKNKVLFDLEYGNLPFRSFSFDSVTMVFIANYIKDLGYLLREVKRILKGKGKVMVVQSALPIAEFYRIKEKKQWKPKEIEDMLKKLKMKTNTKEYTIGRTKLIFIEALKEG